MGEHGARWRNSGFADAALAPAALHVAVLSCTLHTVLLQTYACSTVGFSQQTSHQRCVTTLPCSCKHAQTRASGKRAMTADRVRSGSERRRTVRMTELGVRQSGARVLCGTNASFGFLCSFDVVSL
jgi:hypothetical protein